MNIFDNVEALSMRVPDGAFVALPPEYSWVPASLARALIVQGTRDLHVLCVPIGGITVDMLIGAGCIGTLEAAAVSLGEAGLAPRFTDAVQSGSIRMKDSTCPAIHAGLQAAEKGVPFMPLGGIIGSDIEANRDDYDIVWFDLEPGDCTVHHALTVHGAPGNASNSFRRRAYVTRWTGDDVTYNPRPNLMKILRDPGIAAGDPLDCDLFPVIWNR